MLVSVIAIGNSKGIRLPKTILEQLHVTDKLDLEVENHQIVLKPIVKSPRTGWTDSFVKMHERKEDVLLINEKPDTEAFEWEW